MRKVIEQPCSSPAAKSNFYKTIENSVQLNQLQNYISASEYNDLNKIYPSGECNIWGVNSGDQNTPKFKRLEEGDVVLFFERGRAFYCADITYKLSETKFPLAQFLWLADYQNNFEHIYFLNNVKEIDISIDEYNVLHGDRIKNSVQNFNVLWKYSDEDRINRIINAVKPPNSSLASNSDRNVWIEKTIVHNRPDRLSGDRALGNAIWSPTERRGGGDIYSNMRDVKQGDLIVHLIDNSHFSGVSLVKNDGVLNMSGLENTPWDGDAYLHYLSNYVELEPVIDREEFFAEEHHETLTLIKNESEVFFTEGFELRQGAYLTPSPKRLSQLLNKIYLNKTGKNLPHFNLLSFESSSINLEVFNNVCDKYINHCRQTDWLRDEKYKFNFADWTADNIDFDLQTDEEILDLAKQSQEERYYEQSNVVGVNFILAEKRYKDDFITINDVKYFRELINNDYCDDEPELDHDMTYPKVSAWVSCFSPSNFIAYASGELHLGLAHIADLGKKYPKKGYKAFQFAQSLLHELKTLLMKRDDVIDLYKEHLTHDELTALDWAWITQDFNLFVTRIIASDNQPTYWLFAPGQNASRWDDMYNEKIMAIGWDQLGDFSNYRSLDEMEKKLRTVLNADGSKKNDARCCYDFANTIKDGDIIICKKGRHSYIGYGVVESDYIYDESRVSYTHIRKVDWKRRGEWKETEHPIAIKTLTELTPYPDYIERLKELIGIGEDVNYWWMNANPAIWNYSEMKVDDARDYTTHNDRGNKRRIYKHMEAVKPGDPIIGYIASPTRKVTSLLEITEGIRDSEQGEIFSFKKIEDLNFPVSFDELKTIPELQNSEVMISSQGSLFKLTKKEFEVIINIIADRNPKKQDSVMEPYTIEDATKDLFMSEDDFRVYLSLLKTKKNIVLQGPPGVGKTFVSKRLAYALLGQKNDTNVEMIQFHQTYSYEDFIQGYRPNPDGGFSLATGIFYNICKRAENNLKSKYVLVVDEINRGNLSKIFGELLMLIESDKRGKNYQLSLTYSPGEKFSIPDNVYLIGTMNTADRSIAMVDYALRRRFSFLSLLPQFNKKFNKHLQSSRYGKRLIKNIIDRFSKLNEEIISDNNLGDGYQIGHSYFCPDGDKPYNNDWYNKKINYEIAPLLKEYWFDEPEKVTEIVDELLIK